MSRLDDFLQREFEREARELPEAEARREALKDPFKRPRSEPGRARPNHGQPTGRRSRASTSLGGKHS